MDRFTNVIVFTLLVLKVYHTGEFKLILCVPVLRFIDTIHFFYLDVVRILILRSGVTDIIAIRCYVVLYIINTQNTINITRTSNSLCLISAYDTVVINNF